MIAGSWFANACAHFAPFLSFYVLIVSNFLLKFVLNSVDVNKFHISVI